MPVIPATHIPRRSFLRGTSCAASSVCANGRMQKLSRSSVSPLACAESTVRGARAVSSTSRRAASVSITDGASKAFSATSSSSSKAKQEGDISSVFASLSKEAAQPLPQRFVDLKREIVGDRIDLLYESWKDLLPALKGDVEIIRQKGNKVGNHE